MLITRCEWTRRASESSIFETLQPLTPHLTLRINKMTYIGHTLMQAFDRRKCAAASGLFCTVLYIDLPLEITSYVCLYLVHLHRRFHTAMGTSPAAYIPRLACRTFQAY